MSLIQEVDNESPFKGFKGFSIEELRAAFEKMENPENWKLPLKAEIKVQELQLYRAAAEWYAGSPLEIKDLRYVEEGKPESILLKIEGSGYYVNIGA